MTIIRFFSNFAPMKKDRLSVALCAILVVLAALLSVGGGSGRAFVPQERIGQWRPAWKPVEAATTLSPSLTGDGCGGSAAGLEARRVQAARLAAEWTLNADTRHGESYAEEAQPFLGTARVEVSPPNPGGARTSSGGPSTHLREDGAAVCVGPLFHCAVLPRPQRGGIHYLHSIMVLRL